MSPDLFLVVLKGTGAPALVAAVVLLLAWRPWRRGDVRPPAWGLAATAALGFIAGDVLIRPPTQWWPVDATMRMSHAAVGVGLLAVVGWVAPLWIVRQIARLLMATWLVWLLAAQVGPASWGDSQFLWAAAWVVVLAVFIAGLSAGASRSPTVLAPVSLALVATGLSLVVTLAKSASIGQTLGALASVCGVFALVAIVRRVRKREPNVMGPGGDVIAGLLAGFVIAGYLWAHYPAPPRWSYGMVLLSALPVSLISAPVLKTRAAIVHWLAVLIPLLAILGAAVWLAPPDGGADGGGSGDDPADLYY